MSDDQREKERLAKEEKYRQLKAAAMRAETERIRHRLLKADLIQRGLCRQCGKRRLNSPSKSRCLRCVKRARAAAQQAAESQPYQPGKPGRPPMDVRKRKRKQETP